MSVLYHLEFSISQNFTVRKMSNFSILNSLFESHWKWTVTQTAILVLSFLIGKLDCSFNCLLFLISTNMRLWNMKNVYVKSEISRIIRNAHTDEEIIRAQLGSENIPSWVTFPDYESSEWINEILKRVWPYLVSKFEEELHSQLNSLNFADGLEIQEFKFGSIVSFI